MNERQSRVLLLAMATAFILTGMPCCETSPAPEGEPEAYSESAGQPATAPEGAVQPSGQAPASAGGGSSSAKPSQTTAGRSLQSRPQQASEPPASAPVAPAPPPAPAPRQATLGAGTALQVRTTNTLSTKAAKSGETFSASLEEPITHGGWVIAPKGSTVLGTIVDSDPGGRVKGLAKLTVRLTQLQTADGQQIPIATDLYITEAESSKKEDAKKVGIGAGIGAVIGGIAGGGSGAAKGAGVGAGAGAGAVVATRGDPAVIPSESVLSFKLTDDVTITERK